MFFEREGWIERQMTEVKNTGNIKGVLWLRCVEKQVFFMKA